MPLEKFDQYLEEARALKEKYKEQIQLYVGLEVDFIPGIISPDTDYIEAANLDHMVGSIHYVDHYADGKPWEVDGPHQPFLKGLKEIFDNDIEKAVRRYFELTREMVESCPGIVVGHLDKIKMQNEGGDLFSEESDWYIEEVEKTLELIAEKGLIVEVNTRGIYKKKVDTTYPSPWILERIREKGIPIMLNSDSHTPDELTGRFEEAARMLLELGFKELMVFWHGEWKAFGFNEKGLELDD
jgi:histidinol-phosphatase (PHP family)